MGRALYHVSHTAREHMLAQPVVRYVRVEAGSAAEALLAAQAELGHLRGGEWAVAEHDARVAA